MACEMHVPYWYSIREPIFVSWEIEAPPAMAVTVTVTVTGRCKQQLNRYRLFFRIVKGICKYIYIYIEREREF